MGFYLDICNNSMEFTYFNFLSDDERGKCIHIEELLTNPNYFKRDETFNDYITNYTKKIDLYLVRCEFEVEFINFTDFRKSKYFFNTSIVKMKNLMIYHF